jgi:hypothetical protein
MKSIKLVVIATLALAPALSQAQEVQVTGGANYEHGIVHVGDKNVDMDGLKFQATSEYSWGNIKGTASDLSGGGAEYQNYSFSYEKPIAIQQSNFFISPEVGITYSRYDDGTYDESDFGPMVGASLGYNVNSRVQIVSNYNHSFGMKSSQVNINEDSMNVGFTYRFK